jgi:ankyrin repeat protein
MAAADFAWFFNDSAAPPAPPSALYAAASSGDAERVTAMLALASPDARTNGWLALHAAAAKGHAACVEALVKSQGDAALSARTAAGELAVHLSAKHGHLDCLRFFGGCGPITDEPGSVRLIDALDSNGHAPLHHASHGGHLDAVKWLLDAGADPRVSTPEGMTPLLVAAAKGEVGVLVFLAGLHGGVLASARSSGGATALHKAAAAGHLTIVTALLAFAPPGGKPFVDVNAATAHGVTALHLAASGGHVSVLRALAAAGGDPHARTPAGQSGLHKACFEGHVSAVEVLLELGVCAARVDAKGYTPLHCAASGGRHRIVDRLCRDASLHVDVRARLPSGEDAAILAANNGFQDLASKLTRLTYIALRAENLRARLAEPEGGS